MPASKYLKDKLRRHVFGTASFTKPAAIYIGLFATQLDENVLGTEVSAPSYARVRRDPGDANWAFPTAGGTNQGETSNIADLLYPDPAEAWGDVVAMAAFDAASGGNPIAYGNLLNPKTINSGDSAPKFPAGLLKFIFS
jgi:hypothetical protein